MSTRPSTADATRTSQDVIRAIGLIRRRIRTVVADDALTPPQTSALTVLGRNGAATASALAAAEGVRPQSMAATLAALEQQGLIERHADPNDGRRQVVTLSASGEAAFRGARTARHAWFTEQIRQQLTVEENRTLGEAAAILERLASAE